MGFAGILAARLLGRFAPRRCRWPIGKSGLCSRPIGKLERAEGAGPGAVLPRKSRVGRGAALSGAERGAERLGLGMAPGLLGPRLGPLCSRLFARYFQAGAATKKAKAEGSEAGAASPLSPEQLERIRRNKEAALQRLADRNVPPGFGESWRRQLAKEFSKPYFMEVSVGPVPGSRPGSLSPVPADPPALPAADGLRGGGEEAAHRVPAPGAGLHLDADVRHQGCEWGCGGAGLRGGGADTAVGSWGLPRCGCCWLLAPMGPALLVSSHTQVRFWCFITGCGLSLRITVGLLTLFLVLPA